MSEQFLRAALAALNACDEDVSKEAIANELVISDRFAAKDHGLNSSPERLAVSILAIMTRLRAT